ncbi:MAG: murE [Acidimicrobiales bacterium]|nr:murE [Acidimicrobiales bacterium]
MRLDDVLEGLAVEELRGDASVEVTGVTHDSRRVGPGSLFCCIPGRLTDGHAYASAAVAAGAVALLCERPLGLATAEVVVADARAAMGPIAAAFHGHPSSALDVVGVTGTNGKTTTTFLLQAILEAAGRSTGVIGTLDGARTTPEAPDLQARLAELRDEGRQAVAMEVSSHALALDRVAGTRFRVAVFTNLSRDHLDFHDTMEDYFAAKARLFEPRYTDAAVVNADDPRGQLLADAAEVPTRTYSLRDIDGLVLGPASSTGTWRGHRLLVPLGGAFNVANALAALTAAVELGVDEATAVEGLARAPQVPGRFESVGSSQPFQVVVDYAHTPDGVEQVLRAARALTSGRVLVVVGAGGDKDRAKRPMMGGAAARHADVVVITSDNPRSEDPQAIADAVVAGTSGHPDVRIELDRRAAIELAIRAARPGDMVVVAGKGHETTQTIGDRILPFDDRQVVREVLDSPE